VIKLARRKTKKFRGSMTHGKGKKGGRGAGLRGGRGNAGLLKHRYMHMTKNMPDHFGKHGFKRPQGVVRKDRIINVGQLEEKFPGKKDIDLEKEGFNKLLGGGELNNKLKIKVNSASEKAIEKIKDKGGEVILPEIPEEPVEETPAKEPPKEEIPELPKEKEKIEEPVEEK
jgi:large subunit ribosomal protein L15